MTLSELNRHMDICARLKDADQMITKLRASAEPQSPLLTDMPHGGGAPDKIAVIAAEIADLEAKQRYLRREAVKSEKEIRRYTDGIDDAFTRLVFNLRFIGCMSWKEVADAVGGSNTAASVRQQCYRYLRVNEDGWND